MPTAREHLTAASASHFIYVIGGRNGPSTNRNDRYDPATNTWQTMAPMPTARSATATTAFGNRIFVMGGEVPRLFDVNEVYDIATNTWSCQALMAIARHGIAAVAFDDRILTPAGGLVQGLLPTNAVDSFIPETVPGDLDGNGSVGTSDLLILLSSWGSCDNCKSCPADLDDDCNVGTSDLLILFANWG